MNASPRILVVDDERDICANLQDILSEFGYQVDTTVSAHEGLAMAAETHYDVALVDLRMPGMNGLEFCRHLKRIGAGTVGILVTAYASQETTAEALTAGAWKILSKPVDLPRLTDLLEEAVRQPFVLAVDDDIDLCESLFDVLTQQGYRVALAHDVRDAAAKIGERRFRVVLIDMKLPGGSGDDVYRLVRESDPEAHVLVITGYCHEATELLRRIREEGVDSVCYKPFDMVELLAALERLSGVARKR